MRLPLGMDTPLGVLRLVQFLYIKHYPFPYQIPYRFVYRKGILHLEVAPLKRWYDKFIPILVNLGTILLSTMSIFYLAMNEDRILRDIRFWVWMSCIIVSISSTYANLIVVLDTGQARMRIWEGIVEFDWHVREDVKMHLPFGMDTPLGVLRIVQFFYIKHYPFPYQIPYRFVYRRGILYLEVVPLKRWYHKFIPLLVTLGTILLCILSVFYLAMDEDEIL
ncbi:hypothetical protein Fcan01_10391 [Folsomia candida]|uniref:Uncharacterized protein n=1 Tax=Folsomia candida TaxID=158441 RepID=A0A226EC37_FOLCA|nr:hypothetical protein Fcan01_10391 [Folsomia candida]